MDRRASRSAFSQESMGPAKPNTAMAMANRTGRRTRRTYAFTQSVESIPNKGQNTNDAVETAMMSVNVQPSRSPTFCAGT